MSRACSEQEAKKDLSTNAILEHLVFMRLPCLFPVRPCYPSSDRRGLGAIRVMQIIHNVQAHICSHAIHLI